VELRRDANAQAVLAGLIEGVKGTFEVTPELILLETGTLAKEFESSVKAPRFTDSRT
jgi:phenylacetate-CoA ligase